MSINGNTKIIGIFGWPLTYTLSPTIHNGIIKSKNKNAVYLPFPVSTFKDCKNLFKSLAKTSNFLGCNITNPYKVDALELADELTDRAEEIGAINLLYKRNFKWIGDNTDSEGFKEEIKDLFLKDKNILIMGDGGACRAIYMALKDKGVNKYVTIASRNVHKTVKISKEFNVYILWKPLNLSTLFKDNTIIINTIPDKEFKINASKEIFQCIFHKYEQKIFCDICYGDSSLINAAKNLGYKTKDGMTMLMTQAQISSKLLLPS